MSAEGMRPMPADDTIPVQVSDTVTHGTVTPTYPVIQYPHTPADGGDAIAGGFVYRGKQLPALKGKLVFGDITTGRIWYADMPTCWRPTMAIRRPWRRLTRWTRACAGWSEADYRARGGKGEAMPGMGRVSGRGRVDLRLAMDNEGELYILTKSDGMIRKIVGATGPAATTAPRRPAQALFRANQRAAAMRPRPDESRRRPRPSRSPPANGSTTPTVPPVMGTTPQGAVKAGISISIIEEQRGKQPPDLTDAQWDHGSSDGEIFNVIKRGRAADDDAGIRWGHCRSGDLEHHQLHPIARPVKAGFSSPEAISSRPDGRSQR